MSNYSCANYCLLLFIQCVCVWEREIMPLLLVFQDVTWIKERAVWFRCPYSRIKTGYVSRRQWWENWPLLAKYEKHVTASSNEPDWLMNTETTVWALRCSLKKNAVCVAACERGRLSGLYPPASSAKAVVQFVTSCEIVVNFRGTLL